MAKKEVRQVSIFINGKEVENSLKGIGDAKRQVNNELRKLIVGTDEYNKKAKDFQELDALEKKHIQNLRGIKQGWDLTKVGLDNFVGIAAGAFTVDAILGYGKELFNTAVKMEALEKKAQIVFGETLPAVTEAAKKNATQMGLTSQQYIGAAAAIQDLLVPMGFARKQAADITTQLVNLSGALSEWTGGQVSATEVSDILAAALTGERERLKQLGIVLQQSDIDARLAEKGQAKLEGTLRQQAEAVATLDLILQKSQDAQNSYADNADSMARRTAELTARFQEIKEALAEALIPIFEGFVNIVGDVGDGLDWLAGKFDNPAWEKAGKILAPIFDPKGSIIRLFATKDEDKEALDRAKALAAETRALAAQYAEKEPDKAPAGPTEEEKKQAEAAAKRRKQEAERLAKDLEDLIRRTTETRLDLISKAQEDELSVTIRGIEKRYDAEIAKALELEKKGVEEATAQRIALEALKQKEIGLAVEADIKKAIKTNEDIAEKARQEAFKKELEQRGEEADERLEFLEDKAEAEKEIRKFVSESQASEWEQELDALREHYKNLLAEAEKYGFDTSALKESFRLREEEIKKKALEEIEGKEDANTFAALEEELEQKQKALKDHYAKLIAAALKAGLDIAAIEQEWMAKSLALTAEYTEKRLMLVSASFRSIASSLEEAFSLFSDSESEFVAFQKALAIAQIAIDTATAISGIVAAAASTSITPIDLAIKIAAGVALVLANIAKAKKLLETPLPVKQKASGRYLTVTGEDDGRTYNASVIPAPYTGLLPPHPVLFQSNATGQPVLASERGAEYFVSSEALRNPYVANLTRMIDNITTGRGVAQFAEGGANPATTATPSAASSAGANAGESAAMMRDLATSINTLNALLSRGIIAVVPDGTVLDIQERFEKINNGSGGYYG